MFDCQHISRLVAESKVRKLRFREKVEFVFHVTMCPPCRLFSKFQKLIDRAISRSENAAEEWPSESWEESQKERVADNVAAAISEKSD